MQLKRTSCDLGSLLRAACDMVRPSADAKGLEFELTVEPQTLPITCDADRLQQVLWNLLSNAVKFTPAGGRVTAHLGTDERSATITVSDTGIGIPAGALPYVFQRFWQGERADERQTGGLGLGLALARHFTELHGGTITADSEGPGRGATFTVFLPRSS
jgi:signal transduction histidine kinase